MKEPDQEFTREILRKVRQIEIKSNRLVSEVLSGSYQSAFKVKALISKRLGNTSLAMR
jgi:hypothetical protein